jgi:hypothetical protein
VVEHIFSRRMSPGDPDFEVAGMSACVNLSAALRVQSRFR